MLFGKLLNNITRRRRQRRGQQEMWPAKRRLTLEHLETRRLLALLQYTPDAGSETELILNVNEQGAFGYSDDLAVNDPNMPDGNTVGPGQYNPVGTIDLSGTTFASGIAIGFGEWNGDRLRPELIPDSVEERVFLTAGYIGGRGDSDNSGNNLGGNFIDGETEEPDVLVSEFFYPNSATQESEAILKFRLVQTLTELETNSAPSGVVLEQNYTIENVSDEELHFDIIRYMDADLYAFDPAEPGLPDTRPGEPPDPALNYLGNGGGLRRDGSLQNLASVYTVLNATDDRPSNDTTIVTIRGNPDDEVAIPPGEVNRWELGRGSAYWLPDHNVWNSEGYVTLRVIPDNPLFPQITPGPWWKTLHADWWHTYFATRDPNSFDPSPSRAAAITGRDAPDAHALPGTLLNKITTGGVLADSVTNDQTFPGIPPIPAKPDPDSDDGTNEDNDIVDLGNEYDVAMALRNVYTRVAPGQQYEYYTQTVFGHPPLGQVQTGKITGLVWDDVNGDGTYQPATEQGLSNVRVWVDINDDGIRDTGDRSIKSGPDGVYQITNVPAGTYKVREEVPDDYNQTFPVPPGEYTVTVIGGGIVPSIDFGNQFNGGYVSGIKFMDLNGNGVLDPDTHETPLGGWTIYDDANLNGQYDFGEPMAITSQVDGSYLLTIPLGENGAARDPVVIREIERDNWTPIPSEYTFTLTTAGELFPDTNFGNDPDPFTVEGIKWEDEFANGVFDNFEDPMPGVTIYIDVDPTDGGFNNLVDIWDVTAADGSYSLSSGDEIGPGTYKIREVIEPTFDPTNPSNGTRTITAVPGQAIERINFGNRYKRATATGVIWQDNNGNGTRESGEPGMGGVFVFVDMNQDGIRSLSEPGTVSNANGRYTIGDIRPGGPYDVRQERSVAQNQTSPAGGVPYTVTLDPAQTLGGLDFGNGLAQDFGDAPTAAQSGFAKSYPTTRAQNGPVHEIVSGYMLGTLIDTDANGQPTSSADGDDLDSVVNDEDGFNMVTPLIPGRNAEASIFLTQEGLMANRPPQGFFQVWIDFNQDGDWQDAGEWVIKDYAPQRGDNRITFRVPGAARLGTTYARVRLGIEPGLSFNGASLMGEVEDHVVNVVTAASLPDLVGRTSNGIWRVGVNSGTGFTSQTYGRWNEADGWDDVLTGDFNDDGLTDVAGRMTNGRWQVSLNTGSGFTNQIWGAWRVGTWQFVNTGDFTGDGLVDIIGWNPVNEKWVVARNTGSQFVNEVWGVWPAAPGWNAVVIGNFAGSDRLDILGLNAANRWFVGQNIGTRFFTRPFGRWNNLTSWTDVQAGDITGDAYDDVVGRNLAGKWVVGVSNGGRLNNEAWGQWNIFTTWSDVTLADFNGDGLLDLMGRDSGNIWQMGQNMGSAFANVPYGAWLPGTYNGVLYADFTGDGLIDVVGRRSGVWQLGRNTGSSFDDEVWGSWDEGLGWQDEDFGLFN